MTPLDVALAGLALLVAAALLASFSAPRLTAAVSALAGLTVLGAGVAVLVGAPTSALALPWLPGGPAEALRLDPLAAFFLVPIGLIGALGPIYGLGYWRRADHPGSERPVRAGYAVLTASLVLVALARDGAAFLLAWEGMALSGFLLILAEHGRPEVRSAGLIYLIATHVSTLALWWFFARVQAATGVFGFAPLPAGDPATLGTVLVGLVGFGLKAGFIPLHVWLPGAHAAAPTHVSALLSGVVLKVGVYGVLRATTLAPDLPVGVGGLVLVLGAVAAVLGVALALAQHDLKRLLAYHSIENIGIILLGLGLALVGRSTGHPTWVALGLAGALLHVWNHAIFKSLLFFGAGAAIHAAGTRLIDRLGGLAHRQPVTAFAFLVGAVAISGLPPLNGFASELLVYLGLFDAAQHGAPAVALAAPALALTGALALACFVKVYGVVFLGAPRTPEAAAAHPAPPSMRAPMLALVAL
ncbi:MAG: hydrogenase, partial [Deltaproteobacteria bacterium]